MSPLPVSPQNENAVPGSGPPPKCHPCERLIEGRSEYGDCSESGNELPPWFNLKSALKGQKIAYEKLSGISESHLVGLCFLLLQREAKVLFYTQNSNSKLKAYRRYLATFVKINSWYESPISEDLSCPFFQSLQEIRRIHSGFGKSTQKKQPDFSKSLIPRLPEGATKTSRREERYRLVWEAFEKDLNSSNAPSKCREVQNRFQTPAEFYYFNQFHMASTLWSFAAVPALFPEKLGLHNVSDDELEGFVHLWAVIGHFLGIKPEYNICLAPDLAAFKSYAREMFESYFLPDLFQLSPESKVLCVALAEGISHVFPLVCVENFLVKLLEDYVEVECRYLRKQVPLRVKVDRWIAPRCYLPLLKFEWFQRHVNGYIRKTLAARSRQLENSRA